MFIMNVTKQSQGKEALLKSYNKRLKDDVKSILDNFMGKPKFFCFINSHIFWSSPEVLASRF